MLGVLGLISCVEIFFIPPARLQGNSPTCLESTNAAQKNNKLFISPAFTCICSIFVSASD
jgi:hypothetical protein